MIDYWVVCKTAWMDLMGEDLDLRMAGGRSSASEVGDMIEGLVRGRVAFPIWEELGRKIGEIHCQVQGQHSKVNCKMLMVLLEAGRRIGECLEVEEAYQEVDLEREQEQMELCRSLDFPRLL